MNKPFQNTEIPENVKTAFYSALHLIAKGTIWTCQQIEKAAKQVETIFPSPSDEKDTSQTKS